MSVTLGVILAHTGLVALALIQVHTSDSSSQSCPMAIPIRLSGMPCGQLRQGRAGRVQRESRLRLARRGP